MKSFEDFLQEWVEEGQPIINKLKATGLKFVEFPNPFHVAHGGRLKGDSAGAPSSILAKYSYRHIALININGVNMPFYQSTGEGGKENVAAGKWYPFFGIGSDGWLNKGQQNQIIDYYGSPQLKAVASKLDAATGDIRDLYSKLVVTAKEGGPIFAIINQDMNPSVHKGGGEATAQNIQGVLQKLGVKTAPTAPTNGGWKYGSNDPASPQYGGWKYGSNDPASPQWGGNDSRNFQKQPEPAVAGGWKYGSNDPASPQWGGNDSRNFESISFKDWLLNEMPISKFQLTGQWGQRIGKLS